MEAVKLAAGIGTVMARRLLIADALAGRFSTVQLRPRWQLQAAESSVPIDFAARPSSRVLSGTRLVSTPQFGVQAQVPSSCRLPT